MKRLSPVQLKSLSEFANTVAAAWFTAGVIAPVFTRPKSIGDLLTFLLIGVLMTAVVLYWSLFLLEGVKK